MCEENLQGMNVGIVHASVGCGLLLYASEQHGAAPMQACPVLICTQVVLFLEWTLLIDRHLVE